MGTVGPSPEFYEGAGTGTPAPDFFCHKAGMINLTRYFSSVFGPGGGEILHSMEAVGGQERFLIPLAHLRRDERSAQLNEAAARGGRFRA